MIIAALITSCNDYAPTGSVSGTYTLRAAIADESRTLLSGQTVEWQSTDEIGLFSNTYSSGGGTLYAVESISDGIASFKGNAIAGSTFYAYYPYQSDASFNPTTSVLTLDLPETQQYTSGSFASGSNPMVGFTTDLNNMIFYNLCGVIELQITGLGKITSIEVESNGTENLSGMATFAMTYTSTPASTNVLTFTSGTGSVTLTDVDTYLGSTATSFYIVVPAQVYASGLKFTIQNDSGTPYVQSTTNSVAVSRSNIKPFATFQMDVVTANGTIYYGSANSYAASGGESLNIDTTPHYTYQSEGYPYSSLNTVGSDYNPTSAAIVWQQPSGVVSGVSLSGTTLNVGTSSTLSGNALVGVYNGSTLLWSYHIWVNSGWLASNDQQYYLYGGATGAIFADRNLGATSATATDATGLMYQWGRKDPFELSSSITSVASSATTGTSAYGVANPTTFISGYSGNDRDWLYAEHNPELWGYTATGRVKSVFDPCPEGYMVPVASSFTIFTSTGGDATTQSSFNIDGSFNSGWTLYYQGWQTPQNVTTFFPVVGYISGYDGSLVSGGQGYWHNSLFGTSDEFAFNTYFSSIEINPDSYQLPASYGFSVRCCRQ